MTLVLSRTKRTRLENSSSGRLRRVWHLWRVALKRFDENFTQFCKHSRILAVGEGVGGEGRCREGEIGKCFFGEVFPAAVATHSAVSLLLRVWAGREGGREGEGGKEGGIGGGREG